MIEQFLAEESFWRFLFDCSIALLTQGERIVMDCGKSYFRTEGLRVPVSAAV